ncbi:MAG: DUF885 domain-containing protein [Robiginitomaculum sp.]|nr:DUF885 domain-containing protein [Robiginitomaculum sp.]
MRNILIAIIFGTLSSFLLSSAVKAQSDETVITKTHLYGLIDEVGAFDLSHNPIAAGNEGDMQALSKMPDVSKKTNLARQEQNKKYLKRINAILQQELLPSDRINADLLHYMLSNRVARGDFDTSAMPFSNDSGFHTSLDFIARTTRITSIAMGEAWVARLNDVPRFLAEHRANISRGVTSGFSQPKIIVQGVVETLEAQIADDSMLNSLLAPLSALPVSTSAEEKQRLTGQITQAFKQQVLPAYQQTYVFMRDEVLPKSRDSIGISAAANGREYYEVLVKAFTTTDMSAQQVHDLGKSEVARIRAEMQEVIAETGFEGSFAEFLEFLRTDPQFYAKTEDELLMRASYISKQADDKMPEFFGLLPRLSYGVRPVPASIAPNYTTARYWPGDIKQGRAGGYMVNTYDLKSRPLYELPALSVHEAVPGHHHQIALAQELKDVPKFRKRLYVTAFGEGWGLYTEKLAVEMGIYKTPYEHFGRLTYEMWRACRLVMDTGIHAFGWTREQAKACLTDNSALALHNIETETNRYISWPGQALGYKIGELTIWRLRHKAETELGDKFDIRAFHDEILKDGAMTMAMLEAKINGWIKRVQGE